MKIGLVKSYILWYAIALHAIWAGILFGWPEAAHTTSLDTHREIIGNTYLLASMFTISTILAVYAILVDGEHRVLWLALFLLPQQFALMISAYGAGQAMINGEFADGTQRSQAFLIADQCPAILAATLHMGYLIEIYFRIFLGEYE